MRRFLLLLALLCIASTANAWPTITTYTFREGDTGATVSTGWTDTAVRYAATSRNYGGDDSLAIAPIAASVYGEAIILLKCDFAAGLPAGFVCTRAFAGIYKHTTNGEPSAFAVIDQLVWVYRSMGSWTEGDGTGMNINTGNFGGNTSGATAAFPDAGGTGAWVGGVDSQDKWTPFKRTGTEATIDTSSVAAAGYWGTDDVFNDDAITGTTGNIPSEPESEFYLRTRLAAPAGPATDKRGYHFFEVTHFVNLVLSGAIENNGWVLTNSTSNLTLPSFLASSENATVSYRPMMFIEGFVPGSGGGSPQHSYGASN